MHKCLILFNVHIEKERDCGVYKNEQGGYGTTRSVIPGKCILLRFCKDERVYTTVSLQALLGRNLTSRASRVCVVGYSALLFSAGPLALGQLRRRVLSLGVPNVRT